MSEDYIAQPDVSMNPGCRNTNIAHIKTNDKSASYGQQLCDLSSTQFYQKGIIYTSASQEEACSYLCMSVEVV